MKGLRMQRVWLLIGRFAFYSLPLFVLVLAECDSQNPSNSIATSNGKERALWAASFEAGLKSGFYRGDVAPRIQSLLDTLESSDSLLPPYLLKAICSARQDKSQPSLAILFYDEKKVVATLRVREYTSEGQLDILEDYELYPGGRSSGAFLDNILVPFRQRTKGQGMDSDAWRSYVSKGIVSRDLLPPIWISIPTESRRVEISLLDTSGGESNTLQLREERAEDAQGGVSGWGQSSISH